MVQALNIPFLKIFPSHATILYNSEIKNSFKNFQVLCHHRQFWLPASQLLALEGQVNN